MIESRTWWRISRSSFREDIMAFVQTSAALGQRDGSVLSADNPCPERHIVIDLLRKAAPLLGLKPPVIVTLDALLSCLPPRRNHHTVFASNATLSFRRNGISDRTIRRHVAALIEAGLLVRNDSPNGKRFMRRNPVQDCALRFGFDLSPLFARLAEIAHMAADATRREEQRRYLQGKLRAAIHRRLQISPEDHDALMAQRCLRRKLDLTTLETLLATMETAPEDGPADMPPQSVETPVPSASDGQNVRHHHKSREEHIDKNTPAVSVADILTACPEAAEFSLRPISTPGDVIAHARTLAPMVGIDMATYDAADQHIGTLRTALAVWIVIKLQTRIRNTGAYFRSITSGTRAHSFDPYAMIARLARQTPVLPAPS